MKRDESVNLPWALLGGGLRQTRCPIPFGNHHPDCSSASFRCSSALSYTSSFTGPADHRTKAWTCTCRTTLGPRFSSRFDWRIFLVTSTGLGVTYPVTLTQAPTLSSVFLTPSRTWSIFAWAKMGGVEDGYWCFRTRVAEDVMYSSTLRPC